LADEKKMEVIFLAVRALSRPSIDVTVSCRRAPCFYQQITISDQPIKRQGIFYGSAPFILY
jgi:hypothetical protein